MMAVHSGWHLECGDLLPRCFSNPAVFQVSVEKSETWRVNFRVNLPEQINGFPNAKLSEE